MNDRIKGAGILLLGMALGAGAMSLVPSETTPHEAVAQWEAAGYDAQEARRLVAAERTGLQVQPMESQSSPPAAVRRPRKPRPPLPDPKQFCASLHRSKFPSVEAQVDAMGALDGQWEAISKSTRDGIPREEWEGAVGFAWAKMCE